MFVPDAETLKRSRQFTRKLARKMEADERAQLALVGRKLSAKKTDAASVKRKQSA
jgi:hypothetical protein